MASTATNAAVTTFRSSYPTLMHFTRIAAVILGIYAGNNQLAAVKTARDEQWKAEVIKRDEKIKELELKLSPATAGKKAVDEETAFFAELEK